VKAWFAQPKGSSGLLVEVGVVGLWAGGNLHS
jgi:hypothetical protein